MKKIFILGIFIILFVMGCGIVKPNEPEVYNDKDFNIKLIKTVNSSYNSNYLISPYSIEVALNMLKEGANNNTKREIESVVGNREIPVLSSNKVRIANAMFMKDMYEEYIEKSFINNLDKNYKAEMLVDEFKTPKLINDWVNNNTDGMIPKILDQMSKDFVLGLANAIAIDVRWNSEFECINTTSEKFNDKSNVEMMHKLYSSNAKYFENDKSKGIIIPYKDNLEFVGILPNTDVNTYINNIDMDTLNNIDKDVTEATNKKRINLSLPRFSYSFDLSNFKDILISMGIKDAFSDSNADFTNIINKDNMIKSDINNLYVGEAIHKSYIDLNEKGTKAAAVTYFGMFKATAMLEEYETIDIAFNKPFVYMIRDTDTKEILFFGTVYEPNTWKGSTCE